MGINQFFSEVLGAHPKNKRWSWGAVDEDHRRVFLRVWVDQGSLDERRKRILVQDHRNWRSPAARNERDQHLSLLAKGYELYGVLCRHSTNQRPNAARIGSFDTKTLLQLGQLDKTADEKLFAQITGHVLVEALQDDSSQLQSDLAKIAADPTLLETTREAIVQARLGQGQFRCALRQRYDDKCAVTNVGFPELLRASHIKPWARSTNEERLDPENGLLLTPNIDTLFDRGFITFGSSGKLRVSKQVPSGTLAGLGPLANLRIPPTAKQRAYLVYHARYVFRASET